MRSWKWERGGWGLSRRGSMSKGPEGAHVVVCWGGGPPLQVQGGQWRRRPGREGLGVGGGGGPLTLAWADCVESRDSLKLFDWEMTQSHLCEDNGNPQPFPCAHYSLLNMFTCLTSIRHNITPCCQCF